MVKVNSCVFISGAGTNLKALISSSRNYNFPIQIKLVVSNKKNAPGLILAKKEACQLVALAQMFLTIWGIFYILNPK